MQKYCRSKEVKRSNLVASTRHQNVKLQNVRCLNTMPSSVTFRRNLSHAIAVAFLLASVSLVTAQPGAGGPKGAGGAHPPTAQARPSQKSPQTQQNHEHLAQWMDRHSNLPVEQQQRALQNEPGFHDLPQQTQQRMLDRLSRLNNMPPDQRRRILERNEALEHMNPAQRQQVRGAMQQLGALPTDRRRAVAHAFRELRDMPASQRQSMLNSDSFRSQFSDTERGTLSNLLAVEPLLPVQHPND
jgi:Protein of unknown function (DUF3106)